MSIAAPLLCFQPKLPDPARIISWAHIGDLHMTKAGEQNDLDLIAIVDEINRRFAGSISFVYIPGDVADDGSASAYVAPSVRLIDMGHTHYNELANDGQTLYTATRSTGQTEEGPVGFSVTNIDGAVISWKFFLLDELPVVMITSPADERFITDASLEGHVAESKILVRAKAWANGQIRKVDASLGGQDVPMSQISESNVWQVDLERGSLADGVYQLTVAATDENGQTAEDSIRLVLGASAYKSQRRSERDQDNAVEAWPERGLLGTQLGPNKNRRKW
jgi:3',5'-cyclic-AMP phosphodiesterase